MSHLLADTAETWEIPFGNKEGSCQHQLVGTDVNEPSQS